MVRKAVVLDCDPGVDDALAIALALASPELRLLAITTTHGNAPVSQGTENALRVLEVLRRGGLPERHLPPVYQGSAHPLKRARGAVNLTALDVHGGDGLGGISRKLDRMGRPLSPPPSLKKEREGAISALLRIAEREGKRLTVIATGPLTNLARALRVSGSPLRGVREIILMGGTAMEPGNASPVAEFNIFCDPEAAREVFSSGVPITMVGLDVTRKVLLRREQLKGGKGLFRFLR
ncbi:MAG: nucleoside hydrolase, partial [Nitrospinota bacterium]